MLRLPIESHRIPKFQSLHLHTFDHKKRKRSCAISLSIHFFQDDPDYQEIPEELILNLPGMLV